MYHNRDAIKNTYYRKVVKTVKNKYQLVYMSLNPGEDIPWEKHNGIVQAFTILAGKGKIQIERTVYHVKKGDIVVVEPNHRHYVKNTAQQPLKIVTTYSPPEHPPNRRNKRQPKND